MTTEKSSAGRLFLRMLRQECRKYLWTQVIIGLVFASVLPVRLSLVNEWYLTDSYSMSEPVNILPAFIGGNDFLLFGIAGIAIFLALMEYRFLFSRSKVDFYFSLPVTRSMQFSCRYLCGFLHFLTSFTLFYGLTIVYGIAKGAAILNCIGVLLGFYLIYILLFAAMYIFSILAVLFAGNMLMAIINIILIFAAGPGIWYMLELLGCYYYTTKIDVQPSLFDGKGSIFTLGIALLNALQTNKPELLGLTGLMLFLTLSATAFARHLFQVRPADRNSSGMVYSKVAILQTSTASLTGGLMTGLFLFTLSYKERALWLYAGAVAGVVLIHWILQAAIESNIAAFIRRKRVLFINVCAICLIISIYRFDLTGYDTYLPKQESIASAGIIFTELDNYDTELRGNENTLVQNSLLFSGYQPYEQKKMQQIKQMKIETVPDVYKMAEHLISDRSHQDAYGQVYIAWHLKNGRTVYRQYHFDVREHLEFYAGILEDADYRQAVYPLLKETDQTCGVKFSDSIHEEEMEPEVSAAWTEHLLEVYKKELDGVTVEDMLGEEPIWTLRIEKESGDYSYYPVYPSFTETTALLKECGCSFESFKNHAERLILYYEPEASEEEPAEEGLDTVITDPEMIKKIVPHLIPMYYISSGISLKQEEKGFIFNVYFNDTGKTGHIQENVVSCYVEKGVLTDELQAIVEENKAEN